MPLSREEQQEINSIVRRFEAATGVQAVAAVIGKADAYPEIPWKAYAMGTALGGFSVALVPYLVTDWSVAFTIAVQAMAVLGIGAVLAAAALFVPTVARLFLDRLRAQSEMRQYASAMFVEREMFKTAERTAVLVLVSEFERSAVILADRGLTSYTSPDELGSVSDSMRGDLRRREIAAAFQAAFAGLETLLRRGGLQPKATGRNELDDEVIAEKGE